MMYGVESDPLISFPTPNRNSRQHIAYQQVLAYWHSLVRRGLPPLRSQIEPQKLEPAFDYLFIAERVDIGHLRVRQCGPHLCQIYGADMRALPLSHLIAPQHQPDFANYIEQMLQEPATLELTLSATPGPDHPPLSGKMALLPLRSDLGDVSRVLGCFTSDGSLDHHPSQFRITDVQLHGTSLGNRQVAQQYPNTQRPPRAIPGQRDHLRLVHSV